MSFRMLHRKLSLAQNGQCCASVVVDQKIRESLKPLCLVVQKARSFLEALWLIHVVEDA